jgi:hypothetical protein
VGEAHKEDQKDQEEPFDLSRNVEDDVDHDSKLPKDSQLK